MPKSSHKTSFAGVAVTLGVDFGANKPERYVRLCYTSSMERLAKGLVRIQKFLQL